MSIILIENPTEADVHRLAEHVRQRQAGAAAAPSPSPKPAPVCGVCRMPYSDAESREHRKFPEERICNLCEEVARHLEERFKADALRHHRDFVNQFRQMVRDVRAGLEEPTFYRGNE